MGGVKHIDGQQKNKQHYENNDTISKEFQLSW